MDKLGLLETFAMTLETGSLNKAARRRGISQSAVSQQIAQLESLLGQQLLLRTPRGVKPTRAGDLVLNHAQNLLTGYEKMQADLSRNGGSVSGQFRINVSTFMGREIVGPVLIQLNQEFPDLDIVMRLEDKVVDVVSEGYDLAIRSGSIGKSGGLGRKISSIETVLIASPCYLDRIGRPEKPEDLARMKLVRNNDHVHALGVPLRLNGKTVMAPIGTGFTVDDPDLMLSAAKSGAGMLRVPKLLIKEGIMRNEFEIVLPNYTVPDKEVFAVYPAREASSFQRELLLSRVADRFNQLRHEPALAS